MFLYVIGSKDGPQKIGFSQDVEKRLSSIQTGNPNRLEIYFKQEVPKDRVRLMEKQIHTEIKHHKISGEWFNLTPEEAKQEVEFCVIRYLDDPLLGKY